MQTPNPIHTSTLWLTGDLRVCSPTSRDPISLPPPVPTSLFPSLPSENSHTHKYHLFTIWCFFYLQPSVNYVRVRVFSWLAVANNADLWRLNCLTFAIHLLAAHVALLQGLFSGGWAYFLFGFCLLPWLRLTFWYLLRLWFDFLRPQREAKWFAFLVFFSLVNWVAHDRIFFLKAPCRGLLTLMVIFRAWKTRQGY